MYTACALHVHCMCMYTACACALLLQAKNRAKELARVASLQLAEEEEEGAEVHGPPYTFMGYNRVSLARSARGRGSRHFPAVLTRNAGIDMMVVDQMRPLLNGGVRSAGISSMLLELHTKEHDRAAIAHEEETAARLEMSAGSEVSPLSAYADKNCWAGLVPGDRYLAAVYRAYSADIAPFLDAEVR